MQSEAPRQRNASYLRGAVLAGASLLPMLGAWTPGSTARAQEFSDAGPTRIRLIDGGEFSGARYALVEIQLGDAVTYWRNPGDSGVAPLFDFAGSQNLGEADALYPQPQRLDEGGSTVFGYRGAAIFPVRLAAADKTQPIHLILALDYAACNKICQPIHVSLNADLPADLSQNPPPDPSELPKILTQVPQALDAEAAAKAIATETLPAQEGKPRWRVTPNAPSEQIFVEAPDGFYVESEKSGQAYVLTLAEHPAKKLLPPTPVRVTLSGPTPVEFDLLLPAH